MRFLDNKNLIIDKVVHRDNLDVPLVADLDLRTPRDLQTGAKECEELPPGYIGGHFDPTLSGGVPCPIRGQNQGLWGVRVMGWLGGVAATGGGAAAAAAGGRGWVGGAGGVVEDWRGHGEEEGMVNAQTRR